MLRKGIVRKRAPDIPKLIKIEKAFKKGENKEKEKLLL
jgi:hypothetical protein